MKKYEDGIDFILVSFYRFDYIKILIDSIKKYVKGIDYTVHVINNGKNNGDGNGYDVLKEMFSDNPNVKIHKGIDQDEDSNSEHYNDYICKIDGRQVSIGSYTQAKAMKMAIKKGNRKYLSYIDCDLIFLNEWVEDILPLLEEPYNHFFVSHMWRQDLTMDAQQFVTLKRESIENNYLNEPEDIYPNIHYKDTGGMLSYYAMKKDLPFVILQNSFQDKTLTSEHLMDLPHGQQSWINGKPIVYHYGHGSTREDEKYQLWIDETTKYLGEN
tara:strand:+ start:424 stop:1233 length:810 start_codon:yes stop_codon:yes gene_type:complete